MEFADERAEERYRAQQRARIMRAKMATAKAASMAAASPDPAAGASVTVVDSAVTSVHRWYDITAFALGVYAFVILFCVVTAIGLAPSLSLLSVVLGAAFLMSCILIGLFIRMLRDVFLAHCEMCAQVKVLHSEIVSRKGRDNDIRNNEPGDH